MFADQSVALDRAVIRDQVCAQMAGKGHSGYRSADHLTSRCHGPSDDPAVDSATGWRTAGSAESWCYGSLLKPDTQPAAINHSIQQIKGGVARTVRSRRAAGALVTPRRTV